MGRNRRWTETGEDRALLGWLRARARFLTRRFGLRKPTAIVALPAWRKPFGICYPDGTIYIRLHARFHRQYLAAATLIDTLCHELAHLRHMNHQGDFKKLYARILAHEETDPGLFQEATTGGLAMALKRRRRKKR